MKRRNLAFLIGAITVLLFVAVAGVLFYELSRYRDARSRLPNGLTVAGVDVSGLSPADAGDKVLQTFLAPVELRYHDDRITLNPYDLGFQIDQQTMVAEATASRPDENFWTGFRDYLLGRKVSGGSAALKATYSSDRLQTALQQIARAHDHAATPPAFDADKLELVPGQPGTHLNVQKSLPLVEAALQSANNRVVDLVLDEQPAEPAGLDTLRDALASRWHDFDGVVGFDVLNLASGEETGMNANQPFSGMSSMNLSILVEAYRKMPAAPDDSMLPLLTKVVTETSHTGANELLKWIGDGDAFKGAQKVTETLATLGLKSSFIAAPFDVKTPAPPVTTPANSRTDLKTQPDPLTQTTPQEQVWLVGMIYDCSRGGGTLLAAYPADFSQDKCNSLLDLLSKNQIGSLIESGLPEGTRLAHKHGWVADTHADTGIVFSPKGDYALSVYVWRKDGLDWTVSSTRIAELSRIVFNYFNR